MTERYIKDTVTGEVFPASREEEKTITRNPRYKRIKDTEYNREKRKQAKDRNVSEKRMMRNIGYRDTD